MAVVGWRAAMESALYGPGGFYVGAGGGPAGHFRTSVHASPLFAAAMVRLIERVDAALGHPDPFDLVDMGAGRAELLTAIRSHLAASGAGLGERVRYTAVELAPRPDGLDDRVTWRPDLPDTVVGLLVATEWLDNVPLDVAELDHGRLRQVLVDPATGAETLGGELGAEDIEWLAGWWSGAIGEVAFGAWQPETRMTTVHAAASGGRVGAPHGGRGSWAEGVPGERAEIGRARDAAWANAVSRIRRGAALAVDYGHVRDDRPPFGTLTGFLGGRQLPPVPDGSRDVTAHVAIDAVAAAAGVPYRLITQRTALRAFGIDGARPPLDRAYTDPAGYLRALRTASAAAELLDPAGLGGHWWLLHGIGIDPRGIIEP